MIKAFGGPEALDRVARGVARRIVDAEYDLAERRAADAIPGEVVAELDSEDDMLTAALRLTTDTARAASVLATGHAARAWAAPCPERACRARVSEKSAKQGSAAGAFRVCLGLTVWVANLLAGHLDRAGTAAQTCVTAVQRGTTSFGDVQLVVSWGMLTRLRAVLEDKLALPREVAGP